MAKTLEDPPRTYTAAEVDAARHEGYRLAEQLYSEQIKKFKEELKKWKKQNIVVDVEQS